MLPECEWTERAVLLAFAKRYDRINLVEVFAWMQAFENLGMADWVKKCCWVVDAVGRDAITRVLPIGGGRKSK
jgi:hypothetical protein